MRKHLIIAALAAMALVVAAGSALAANGKSVIFDSATPNGPKTNLPSYGPTAYSFTTIGDEINLAPDTARSLNSVTVTLSSWACQQGSWNGKDCVTQPGATFAQEMTLKIYDAHDLTPIATSTQSFDVPYRPSASPKCTDADAGKWMSPKRGVQERPRERRHLQLLEREASRHGRLRDLVQHARPIPAPPTR